MATAETTMTPAELLALPDSFRYELVDGQRVERNMSVLSSLVEGNVYFKLRQHCESLGWVWPGTNGFQCFPGEPGKVRRPDVSFVARARYPEIDDSQGFLTIAPDLAVEVISPNDLASEVNEKIEEYLQAGVQMVWVVDPDTRTVMVHRADGSADKLRPADDIVGENVVEGFRCKVAEFFPS
jgi:Uma2 family endonuclease